MGEQDFPHCMKEVCEHIAGTEARTAELEARIDSLEENVCELAVDFDDLSRFPPLARLSIDA